MKEHLLMDIPEGFIGAVTSGPAPNCPRTQIDAINRAWENPTMIVTLDSKRRLTVPAAVPAKPGDHFLVDFDAEEDALMCRRIASKPNWLKVLKACPVRMDDLPPRRREYFRSKL
jgi:hypothetical protein